MKKELVIRLTKCTLILDENELLQNLPPGILLQALKKGKAFKRLQRVEQYEKSRTDWEKEDIYGEEKKQ